jgi:AcrR family transcriptional regulator
MSMSETELERRLIAAGVALLRESGTEALSLREIARRAGVSHGAPRRYFPTHQTLLAAIAREGFRELGTLVGDTLGRDDLEPRDAVLALARRYREFARDEPGMFALMFRHDLLRGNGIGLREQSRPLFGVLVELLTRAAVPDPPVTAAALWAGLHGVVQLWQWGSLQVATGVDDPDALLVATVTAHLPDPEPGTVTTAATGPDARAETSGRAEPADHPGTTDRDRTAAADITASTDGTGRGWA